MMRNVRVLMIFFAFHDEVYLVDRSVETYWHEVSTKQRSKGQVGLRLMEIKWIMFVAMRGNSFSI